MRKFGLIGYPLGHSFSPEYFKNKFLTASIEGCRYDAYPLSSLVEVKSLLDDPEMCGLNVTIPYKQSILPFLDGLSPEAREMGAVNTLVREDRGWIGCNTDIIGFKETLPVMPDPTKKAIILGTGGASRAVEFVFRQLGIHVIKVSRIRKKDILNYQELSKEIIDSAQFIVNTTPLGMFPNVEDCPDIPYEWVNQNHVCYDLIYNPAETMFMTLAQNRGARVLNGCAMLVAQAEASWRLWND
jgi:shikimate dehydrogenase